MGWFRRQGVVTWVALLALTLQLALSFGHVHGLGTQAPAAAVAAQQTGDGPGPASKPAGDEHDPYCAICAILALLGGAQTASAPVPVAPAALGEPAVEAADGSLSTLVRTLAFHSRAPPLS